MLSLVENLSKKKNPLKDLLSSLNAVISTNESTRIITGHVIYNPAYTYKFQLKTTNVAKWPPSATTPWTLTLLAIHSFRFTYDIPAKKNQ